MSVSPSGDMKLVVGGCGEGHTVEILGSELYVNNKTYGSDILVYDLMGGHRRTIRTPAEAAEYLAFAVLPDRRLALFDNSNDRIYFIDAAGRLLATANMLPSPDIHAQNLDGVVVGNNLVLSEDGNGHILQVDLRTYQVSVLRDLSSLPHWLGAISYSDGTYFICGPRTIYAFRDSGELEEVVELPEYNITGLFVAGHRAFASVNFAGRIYEVDLETGDARVLVSGLNFPQDVEGLSVIRVHLPLALRE